MAILHLTIMNNIFSSEDKIYVAGHRGMVGSAIVRQLQANGYHNLIVRTHKELDLMDNNAVFAFFADVQPRHVFLAAAKVGGIVANNSYPADFIYQNLVIQNNIIHASYLHDVAKLLFLGSSCIYPKHSLQPIKEEYLLSDYLESTNEPYAVAKIAGIKMCNAYNRQYGTNYMSVMPTNLFGPGDSYDLDTSHVVPALIRKMHEAKISKSDHVVVWGTGNPRREFLYSEDLADACVYLMKNVDHSDTGEVINIGVGVDISIRELAELIAKVIGFSGNLIFDDTKPDGTPRKLLDVSRLTKLGWQAKTSLKDGIHKTYENFLMMDQNFMPKSVLSN